MTSASPSPIPFHSTCSWFLDLSDKSAPSGHVGMCTVPPAPPGNTYTLELCSNVLDSTWNTGKSTQIPGTCK